MSYLLFAGHSYYPGGGWTDFRGEYSSLESAETAAQTMFGSYDWFQIVYNNTIVKEWW